MEHMKKERLRTCEAFLAMGCCSFMVMLDNIVTMDKSHVSFHAPETKQQSGSGFRRVNTAH
jgi:hypothetical protein